MSFNSYIDMYSAVKEKKIERTVRAMTSCSYKKCEYDVNVRPLDGNIPTGGRSIIINEKHV